MSDSRMDQVERMMENSAIIYGIPKVEYGENGVTPLPLSVRACAAYLGVDKSYDEIMSESGAAFRMVWDTACWNDGNVDAIFTYDEPTRIFVNALRSIGRQLKMLGRTKETSKDEFKAFIREQIDSGHPCISLGVIGPPEAGVIAGYRESGDTLVGWNVFQSFPEFGSEVKFDACGYYITSAWWENPETVAVIATGAPEAEPFTIRDILKNAMDAMEGRMCGTYAKGIAAYDAWKLAILDETQFPKDAVLQILVGRLMCHGDAMDCLSDGRYRAHQYFKSAAAAHSEFAAEFGRISALFLELVGCMNEMAGLLGGWGRSEAHVRKLAEPDVRRETARLIDAAKALDARALEIMADVLKAMD